MGAGGAAGQAVGAGAVQAVGGVAVGVARLAVDLRPAVLLVQVVVLGRLGAALHRHRDVRLGGRARRHRRRGGLPTGGEARGDWRREEEEGKETREGEKVEGLHMMEVE